MIYGFSNIETSSVSKDYIVSKWYKGTYDTEHIPSFIGTAIWEIFDSKNNNINNSEQLYKKIKNKASYYINTENKDLGDYSNGEMGRDIYSNINDPEIIARLEDKISEGNGYYRYPYNIIKNFLKNNDIKDYFKSNATEIQFLIDAITNDNDYQLFEIQYNDKTNDRGFKRLSYEKLSDKLLEMYHKKVDKANIHRDFNLIANKILEQSFLFLNYHIVNDNLIALEEQRFIKADSVPAEYKIIDKYVNDIWSIRIKDSVVWLNTWKNKEQKEPHKIEFNISKLLVYDYEGQYYLCSIEEKKAYKLNRR